MPLFCQECRAIEDELDGAWMAVLEKAPWLGSKRLGLNAELQSGSQSWIQQIVETNDENRPAVPPELLDIRKCDEHILRQTEALRQDPSLAKLIGRAMAHQAKTGHRLRLPFRAR